MGLDVSNKLFGNFHVNWAGARWFSRWCLAEGLPEPFIGWESGFNDGEQCRLGKRREHQASADAWCAALEEKFPDLAELGKELLANPPEDLFKYLYPLERLSEEEWQRRAVAAWYAILRYGSVHRDTLEYW